MSRIERATSAAQMRALGARFAANMNMPAMVWLRGPIGSGKTTWTQGLLSGLGCNEQVCSPTFALVHTHRIRAGSLYHMDLYRIETAEQLRLMGIRDYLSAASISVIEWPDLLVQLSISPNHVLEFTPAQDGVEVRQGALPSVISNGQS